MSQENEKKQKAQLKRYTKAELIRMVLDMFPDFEGDY
jgi:hypothetical protein